MKKFIFFIIICNSYSTLALPNYLIKDDSTKQTQPTKDKNLVFVELGGNGVALSLNYERYFYDDLSLRIGWGTAVLAGSFIPIMINYSYKNVLEFGVGIVPFAYSGSLGGDIFGAQDSGLLITSVIGFKRINRSFVFKFSITPFYNPDGSIFKFYGGLSLGFSF
ncbi:MAG: hypothetical protein IIB83_08635 [Bacteroidetes bacterium]|nr:hypothetical protein [Bacteroidota bacterium]MCH8171157.1 hypothetical protein [Bacteroidota bacterium]MCH8326603.1 hypothetical protein [Bacteroidota bacterium]